MYTACILQYVAELKHDMGNKNYYLLNIFTLDEVSVPI